MKKFLVILTCILGLSNSVFAQGVSKTVVIRTANLPATCSVKGPLYQKTSATVGLYMCTVANTLTLVGPAAGSGDVVGPASATDNAIVRFDSTTGKLVQDSAVTVDDTTGVIRTTANATIRFGAGVVGGLGYTAGVGPLWVNPVSENLQHDITSLSAARTVTWPDITGVALLGSRGTCTLDGGATATCTATVASGCTPVCTYNSGSVPHIVSCAVSGTTLTAVSATTLDGGVVNYVCVQ